MLDALRGTAAAIKHKLLFDSEITELWLKGVIIKGMMQFYIRKYLGSKGYSLLGTAFEGITDSFFLKANKQK